MNINTAADWWKLVEQTNPKLPEYATEHRRNWDADKAAKLVEAKDFKALHAMYEKLWADLPDNAGIRHQPFFDLCDLCSEAWTVYENVTA